MTKNELKTGDIIVNRGGYLGVVLKEPDYILYQTIGLDFLSSFNDDLTYRDEADSDDDIMEVFRGISFIELDDEEPIWSRDEDWHRPSREEMKEREELIEQQRQEMLESIREIEKSKKNDCILIVAQHFYGNRTETEIKREHIDYFINGYMADYKPEYIADCQRTIVRIPDNDNIVIVYDQTKEDKYIARIIADGEDPGHMPVSCEIPSIGFRIHTRCIACRMDEYGVFQSLQDEDFEKFIHYFPIK